MVKGRRLLIIHKGHEHNKKRSDMHGALFCSPFFGYYDSGTKRYYGCFLDTFLCLTM